MRQLFRGRGLTGIGLALGLLLAAAGSAGAQQPCGDCYSCQKHHCPKFKYCAEGPVRICFERGCGAPICCPCNQPNWGYYQTCWTPWPWPPDWSHCPVQPPASVVIPGMTTGGATTAPPVEEVPEPRRMKSGF